jgi:hypothetical protein
VVICKEKNPYKVPAGKNNTQMEENIKMNHKERGWCGRNWINIRASNRVFSTQQQTIMFHKMQGISSLTQQLLASQKRFSSMVLLLCIKSTEFMNV